MTGGAECDAAFVYMYLDCGREERKEQRVGVNGSLGSDL